MTSLKLERMGMTDNSDTQRSSEKDEETPSPTQVRMQLYQVALGQLRQQNELPEKDSK